MTDKIIFITGATDGIGRETALEFARKGATVLVHGRDRNRCESVCEQIRREGRSRTADYVLADLSSQHQIVEMAQQVKRKYSSIDVLVNNAGVYMHSREITEDGLEATFAVNHMAPFLLSQLLIGLLAAARGPRVITVSSVAHTRAQVDFQNLQGEKHFEAYGAYALSKLGNILFSNAFARKVADRGVTSNSLHPGVIGTKLLMEGFGMGGDDLETGVATSIYLALASEVDGITGKYFQKSAESKASAMAADTVLQEKFWEASVSLVRSEYRPFLHEHA